MITEWRKLTFSTDELAAAITTYLLATRGMAKDDRLGGVAITDPHNVAVTVTIYPAVSGEPSSVELKAEALAALMVAHCIRTRTPLPRRATKSIVVDDDRVALVLSMA
ncbi:hypothetical protein [Desertibaculum subflavum]|uniref:hypothetical protein n=1 Tax=Desertibaculum subflavum TaxID=2268458 RepID=UPI000E669258